MEAVVLRPGVGAVCIRGMPCCGGNGGCEAAGGECRGAMYESCRVAVGAATAGAEEHAAGGGFGGGGGTAAALGSAFALSGAVGGKVALKTSEAGAAASGALAALKTRPETGACVASSLPDHMPTAGVFSTLGAASAACFASAA